MFEMVFQVTGLEPVYGKESTVVFKEIVKEYNLRDLYRKAGVNVSMKTDNELSSEEIKFAAGKLRAVFAEERGWIKVKIKAVKDV